MSAGLRESLWTLGYLGCGAAAGWLNWRLLPGAPQLLPFLVVGFASGLIYAGIRLRGFGYGMMMVVLLFFLQLALMPPLRTETVVRAAIWAFPVGMSFLTAGAIFRWWQRVRFGKFLLMALLVGLGYLLVMILFRVRAQQGLIAHQLRSQFLLGAMQGGFLGLLIEGLEFIFLPSGVDGTE
ncbi:MAG: hypothetical protein ACP5JB_05300 [candidate division WOR-3 bacterium]